MKFLPEARVARLAECHLKQKAGYSQHASPPKFSLLKNIFHFMLKKKKRKKEIKGVFPVRELLMIHLFRNC